MDGTQVHALAQEGGNMPPSLMPLHLVMESCATEQEMNANVTATLARGYEPLNGHMDKYKGDLSICGAAPSLRQSYRELKGDVMACNSAIGFLLGVGVVPRWAMIWDASPLCENFAVPHPDVTYLIGARCHESVFKRLKDCKVIVWHAGGDHNIATYMEEHAIVEPMVNGGSAAVTRGLYLAFALGYRKFHVHGADSSYSDDGMTHVKGSLVPEKDMRVWVNHRWFRTTPEWCAQVEEYKALYPYFLAIGAEMDVYGDGMLQHVHRRMVENLRKLREQTHVGIGPEQS